MAEPQEDPREKALSDYRSKMVQHKEASSRVRALRDDVKTVKKEYDRTEDDLKALQSVGQIIGEVLRQLDEERCECPCRVSTPGSRCWGAIGERPGRRQAPGSAQHPPPSHPPLAAAFAADDPLLLALPPLHHRPCSHRQVQQRAALRGGLPQQGGPRQADAQHARGAGCDDAHHHAHPAARGGPRGVQHDPGGPRQGRLLLHRRPVGPDPVRSWAGRPRGPAAAGGSAETMLCCSAVVCSQEPSSQEPSALRSLCRAQQPSNPAPTCMHHC